MPAVIRALSLVPVMVTVTTLSTVEVPSNRWTVNVSILASFCARYWIALSGTE